MRKRGPKSAVPVPDDGRLPGVKRSELDELFSIAYEDLRRLASRVKIGDGAATLNPTALVHEAWIKLANSPRFAVTSRSHFKMIAARAMRQLLVDAARRRKSRKRGGDGNSVFVVFEESEFLPATADKELLQLDAALDELEQRNPRQALLVEMRFFGGMDIPETAELLEITEATLMREWRFAKAWLSREMRQAG